mmetsp:Transcript_3445/g.7349  ORF Transcript_3445/g.7349 Transcript_3445/m.7349 type:complete len:87 (+) Transcript_3445:90-350(+)
MHARTCICMPTRAYGDTRRKTRTGVHARTNDLAVRNEHTRAYRSASSCKVEAMVALCDPWHSALRVLLLLHTRVLLLLLLRLDCNF